MRTQKAKGKNHFITTAVEHHAMLHSAQRLQKEGYEVTFIPVDREGQIDPEDIRRAIRPETGLVSIMFANNEIGTIYPIKEIGAICRQAGVLFHTDAVQAVGHVKINVKEMNIDMLSLSAHKFHGPKGVGAFYCRRGIPLNNLIDGGAQERGKRAGTENVAGIVGLATALRIADSELEQTAPRLTAMRDRLIDGILQSVPMCRLNGSRTNRLPGNCNISFLGLEGESLLLRLDLAGIAASSGSACASSSLDPSHVLLAIGLPHEVAHGSVRLSLSDLNTEEDVDYILEKLPQGMDTVLGKIAEDGVDVSGGEWQRIAMARLYYQDAELKILDEPTAAIDPVREQQIYQKFLKLYQNTTTIMITHRLGATSLCDWIIAIEDGKAMEQGSHEDLMAKNGIYCEMYETQRRWYL